MPEFPMLTSTFRVDESISFSDYEKPGVEVFKAIRTNDSEDTRDYIAMMAEKTALPRFREAERISRVTSEGLMNLAEVGIYKDSKGEERITFIYERPGEKVVKSYKDKRPPMNEQDLSDKLIRPLCLALREFHMREIAHRGVRPDNIFVGPDGVNFVLGDGLCAPAGSEQPHWVENVENQVTHPFGRGRGFIADDMYNFGATIMYFALGELPANVADKDRLILDKLGEGSFTALMGGRVLPRRIEDILIGLLQDEVTMRWTLEDVEKWVKNTQGNARQIRQPRRASRPFPYNGANHLNVRSLAYGFSRDFSGAVDMILNKSLDRWVRRSVGDEKMADETDAVVGLSLTAGSPTKLQRDNVITKVLMVMDKYGPIYTPEFNVSFDGIGTLYAHFFTDTERLSVLVDLIHKKYPIFWLETRQIEAPHDPRIVKLYDSFVNYRLKKGPAFGPERLLYDLNPELPCLSPIVKNYFITTPLKMLQTLDEIYKSDQGAHSLIDNHVIAFMASHMKGELSDSALSALRGGGDPTRQSLDVAEILAKAQIITMAGPLPNLARRIAQLTKPVIDALKHTERKKRMMKLMEQAIKSGDIGKVLEVADNDTEKIRDKNEFRSASQEFTGISLELDKLEKEQKNRRKVAQLKGEQIAVSIAYIIAAFIILMILSNQFS